MPILLLSCANTLSNQAPERASSNHSQQDTVNLPDPVAIGGIKGL